MASRMAPCLISWSSRVSTSKEGEWFTSISTGFSSSSISTSNPSSSKHREGVEGSLVARALVALR
eukprot:4017493-Pyramimonas_sp.AAC.2